MHVYFVFCPTVQWWENWGENLLVEGTKSQQIWEHSIGLLGGDFWEVCENYANHLIDHSWLELFLISKNAPFFHYIWSKIVVYSWEN